MRDWEELPVFMQCDEVKAYYDSLSRKKLQFTIKRGQDYVMAAILLAILALPMLLITVAVRRDSSGPAVFRQKRVTAYGKCFHIHKFRTMYEENKSNSMLTSEDDSRITRVGAWLRRTRLDELPQLFDILAGNMSFVGTRPEVPEYVKHYTKEMYATLLLPAGVTGRASIKFRNEMSLWKGITEEERSRIYIEQVLPEKMKENLKEIMDFSLFNDLKTLVRTVFCLL